MNIRFLLSGLAAAAALYVGGTPQAQAACSDAGEVTVHTVNKQFIGGSAWSFEIKRRRCEGLVFTNVTYAPANGPARQVLARASIAEIHVPFLTGTPRTLEVTTATEGLGDTDPAGKSWAVPLSAAECEGTRFDGNRVCVVDEDQPGHEYVWKFKENQGVLDVFKMEQHLEVFMSTQVEQENYINKWEFHSDGSIHVSLGITGKIPVLKTTTSYAPYAARLDNQNTSGSRFGVTHQHNVYYRLDFDIAGPGNDQVIKKHFEPSNADTPGGISCDVAGECGQVHQETVLNEAAKVWSSDEQTSWFIIDKLVTNGEGRNIGYELVPHITGIWRGMTSTTEPWAGADLYVTRFKSCELFAAKNLTAHLPAGCSGAAGHLGAMVNGESVDGQNVVVWYANRFLHHHRDEDETHMPIQWMTFEITPRNFAQHSPSP